MVVDVEEHNETKLLRSSSAAFKPLEELCCPGKILYSASSQRPHEFPPTLNASRFSDIKSEMCQH